MLLWFLFYCQNTAAPTKSLEDVNYFERNEKVTTWYVKRLTSSILFWINSSRDAVTSSVITGAGLTLCSKSRSTSNALFFGLLAAVTYYHTITSRVKYMHKHTTLDLFTWRKIMSLSNNNTSPCIVQVFGSMFAFSICSIVERSFSSSFSWVESLCFFCDWRGKQMTKIENAILQQQGI